MPLEDGEYRTFTKAELERLASYRAAVTAGLYTDWDGSAASTDAAELAWLRAADGSAGSPAYPFTDDERRRLEACRQAVASGLRYSDDRPPVDSGVKPTKRLPGG